MGVALAKALHAPQSDFSLIVLNILKGFSAGWIKCNIEHKNEILNLLLDFLITRFNVFLYCCCFYRPRNAGIITYINALEVKFRPTQMTSAALP